MSSLPPPTGTSYTPAQVLTGYLTLEDTTGDLLAALVHTAAEGKLTASQFGDAFEEVLVQAHPQAVFWGRQQAGVQGAYDEDDEAFAEPLIELQAEFLAGFVDDLERGRYVQPEEDTKAVNRNLITGQFESLATTRARMYASALYGSVNRAWVAAQEPETVITWHLASEVPCLDCPVLAEGSPYTAETLPTVPAAGMTQCLSYCRCWLETAGGEVGVRLPLKEAGE